MRLLRFTRSVLASFLQNKFLQIDKEREIAQRELEDKELLKTEEEQAKEREYEMLKAELDARRRELDMEKQQLEARWEEVEEEVNPNQIAGTSRVPVCSAISPHSDDEETRGGPRSTK